MGYKKKTKYRIRTNMTKSKYHNALEEVIKSEIDEVIKEFKGFCNCSKCRTDVIVLTLNDFLPRYIVRNQAKTFLEDELNDPRLKRDIRKNMKLAIERVKYNPVHKKSK